MDIWKELIPGPCTVAYNDERTGELKRATFTPEYNRYLADQGNAMLAAGLSIPVPVEHQQLGPMTPAEKAAADLKNNAGWVKKFEVRPGDKLFQLLSIEDEEMYKKLPKTVKYVSPKINSFTDGNGKKWEGVVTHTALTTRPRIMGQTPFDMAAALSIIGTSGEIRLSPNSVGGELLSKGFAFSRAGFLKADNGVLKPMHPAAFSIINGAKLSAEEIDEIVPDDDDEGEEGEEEEVLKKPKRKMPMDDDNAGFEEACDLGFCELIEHQLKVLGLNPPSGMTEQTFERDLYETLMAGIRELASKGQNQDQKPREDPAAKQRDMGNNPIIQESPPMYASLEEINKLTDPKEKATATMLFSLQEERKKDRAELEKIKADADAARKEADVNKKRADAAALSILETGKKARESRIKTLKGMIPAEMRETLDKKLANVAMSLSLADNGSIVDPMGEYLEFVETFAKKYADAIPDLLRAQETGAKFAVEDQPSDETMTDEQSTKLVDSLLGVSSK